MNRSAGSLTELSKAFNYCDSKVTVFCARDSKTYSQTDIYNDCKLVPHGKAMHHTLKFGHCNYYMYSNVSYNSCIKYISMNLVKEYVFKRICCFLESDTHSMILHSQFSCSGHATFTCISWDIHTYKIYFAASDNTVTCISWDIYISNIFCSF